MHLHEVYFTTLAFFSELIGTLSGVSSSTLFVPLGVLFESIQLTLFLTACLHVIGNSTRIFLYRKDINWSLTFKFGLPSIILAGIGAQYSDVLPKEYFSIVLGVFLVIVSILFWKIDRGQFFTSKWNALVAGGFSGLLTGALGSGGAVRSLALSTFRLSPYAFTATSTVIDLGGDILRLKIYYSKGYYEEGHFFYIPVLMVLAFVANWLAKKWLAKINEEKFRKIVLSFVCITGIISVLIAIIERTPKTAGL